MYDSALSSYHHRQLYNNHAFCKEYIMGKLFFKKHGACFSKAGMELECFRENMRGLAVAVERTCSFKVIHQLIAESRVSDIVNDNLRSFFRGKTADICHTLFGDEYMGVMFGVIDMGAHRNNGRDSASLSHTVAEEAGQSTVAGKVAGTADAVHQFGTGYVSGIYVTINIHF